MANARDEAETAKNASAAAAKKAMNEENARAGSAAQADHEARKKEEIRTANALTAQ